MAAVLAGGAGPVEPMALGSDERAVEDHEAPVRPLGFPQAGSDPWRLGREQVDDFVDPPCGGGPGDPEAGSERFVGVALM